MDEIGSRYMNDKVSYIKVNWNNTVLKAYGINKISFLNFETNETLYLINGGSYIYI